MALVNQALAAGQSPTVPTVQQSLVNYGAAAQQGINASRTALNQLMPGFDQASQQAVGVLSQYLKGGLSESDSRFINTQAATLNNSQGRMGGVGTTAATLLNFNQIQARQQFAAQALPGIQNAMTNWNQQYAISPTQFLGAEATQKDLELKAQQIRDAWANTQAEIANQARNIANTFAIQSEQNDLTRRSQDLSNALAYSQMNQKWALEMIGLDWQKQVLGYNDRTAANTLANGRAIAATRNSGTSSIFGSTTGSPSPLTSLTGGAANPLFSPSIAYAAPTGPATKMGSATIGTPAVSNAQSIINSYAPTSGTNYSGNIPANTADFLSSPTDSSLWNALDIMNWVTPQA